MVQFQKQTLKQRLFWQIWWTGNKNFRTILILIFFLRTFFCKKTNWASRFNFCDRIQICLNQKLKKKEKEEKQLKMQKRILILGNANFLKKTFFSLFLKNFILFHFICIWVQKNVFIFCSPQFFSLLWVFWLISAAILKQRGCQKTLVIFSDELQTFYHPRFH